MALSFDPRRVPVIDDRGPLPRVPSDRLQPQALRERFRASPTWEPEIRREPRLGDRVPTDAAVLLPLVQRDALTVLLTQRAAHMPTHSGQVAFPGGKVDAGDASAVAAALREAWEEVGLEPDGVEVLGTLPAYTTGTGFVITPVVGLVAPQPAWRPDPREVDAVFEVPLDFLMNPAHHRRHGMHWEGEWREWFAMPYADGAIERYIWGATAGMLRNFYRLLSA